MAATAEAVRTGVSPPPPMFSSRREREVFRYAEAILDVAPHQDGKLAVSSRDPALTAYAQLVALRLNAKRALISLIDESNHYFLAEATQTLSLQADNVHDEKDELYIGAAVIPRRGDFFCQTLEQWSEVQSSSEGCALLVVPDLRKDDRYSRFEMVADGSHAAYAGIPLITPSGHAIGALAFLDDKPRPNGLSEGESTFMRDVATTVVAHLELARTRKAYDRGLKMAQGLGRFIEGKETIDDDAQVPYRDLKEMQDRQAIQSANLGASDRTRAMNNASNYERVDDELRKHLGTNRRSSLSPVSSHKPGHVRRTSVESDRSLVKQSLLPGRARPSSSKQHEPRPEAPSGDIQEDLLSRNVRVSFERAAAIITKALDLSGVVFLDASVGEFGQLYSTETHESTSAVDTSDTNTSAASDREAPPKGNTSQDKPDETKPCRLLASSYNLGANEAGTLHSGIPESFLKTLMRHYPYGKVWNYDADGNASSGSESADRGSLAKHFASGEKRKRRKRSDHGKKLQELFPGIRSLGLMPMWDSQRQRFFAGAIVWSYARTRVLTFQEDLNYLGAFCDVIMAEVARLDAQREASTKRSFLSSISHELKTPLHGILGAVECLQDKDNVALQDEMLGMIDSSARSVLEIVHNLIAHADTRSSPAVDTYKYFNARNPESGSRSRGGRRNHHSTFKHEEPAVDLAALTEEVLDISLWSTPQPSPLPNSSASDRKQVNTDDSTIHAPLKVILDVENVHGDGDWNFRVNAGAWRRILLNLISNSIKYTDRGGFLKITLSQVESSKAPHETMVQLVCLDSGRGMSQQFQNEGLWQAFSQEDSHSVGTGLGLNLVRGIVRELGGTVEIRSTKDVGTEVKIKVPLVQGPSPSSPSETPTGLDVMDRLPDPSYALFGFGSDERADERQKEAARTLRQSVEGACNAVGLRAEASISKAAICIISEQKATDLMKGADASDSEQPASTSLAVVLCHSVVSAREFTTVGVASLPVAKAVSQPFGPRKLLKALAECLDKRADLDNQPREPLLTPSSLDDFNRSSMYADYMSYQQSSLPAPRGRQPMQTAKVFSTSGKPQQRTAELGRSTPSPPSHGVHVLLVDDNTLNLRLLETFMKKLGHDYTTATNGLEAVNAVKEYYGKRIIPVPPPMIILLDITMPVMDGFEAARQIRGFERGTGIGPCTIIALTAMNTPEARQEAFSSGLDTFMTKPIRLKDISSLVTEHQEKFKEGTTRSS